MCCLVWMLFIQEFVYVLSGVDVVYTRICRCAVWCGCCLYKNLYMFCLVWMLFIREFVDMLSGVDVVYTRICILDRKRNAHFSISIEYQKSLSNFTLNDMNMFERIHAFAPDRFIRHYTVD